MLPIRTVLSLLLCFVYYKPSTAELPYGAVTNKGYPTPYIGNMAKQQIEFKANCSDCTTAVVFHEFLAGSSDCCLLCDETGHVANCSRICGDVMDHPNVLKILRMESSDVYVTVTTLGGADTYYHAGIYAQAISLDSKNPRFFQCGATYNLVEGIPFYLLSYDYPKDISDFSTCHVQFTTTSSAIRLALYDFYSNSLSDYFYISGDTYDKGLVNASISGKYVTYDEPFGMYFKNSVTIDFMFSSTKTTYRRGFYILVDAYQYAPPSSAGCINPGDHTITPPAPMVFGTQGSPSQSYAPNLDCRFNFHTSNEKSHLLGLDINFESEKCCDIMYIFGIAAGAWSEQNYQGFMGRLFSFAAYHSVSMNFTTDGVVGGVGLNAKVYDIDCTCPTSIDLSSNMLSAEIYSPGLKDGAPSYCPALNCSWTLTFPRDYELVLEFDTAELRSPGYEKDQLLITDEYSNAIMTLNAGIYYGQMQFVSLAGPQLANFVSSGNIYADWTFQMAELKKGFHYKASIRKKDIISKTIKLSDDNYMQSISLYGFRDGLDKTYEFKVSARPSKKVYLYVFSRMQQQVYIAVFNGSTTDYDVFDTGNFSQQATTSGYMIPLETSENIIIQVRRNLFTITPSAGFDFQAMVTDQPQDPNCPGLVANADSSKSQLTYPLNGTNCVLVLHSNYEYLTSGMNINMNPGGGAITMYKGLGFDDNRIIYESQARDNNTNTIAPTFVYDFYLTLKYAFTSTDQGSIGFSIKNDSSTVTYFISGNEVGVFMTRDFLPESGLTLTAGDGQQIAVELENSLVYNTGVTIELLNDPGESSGTVIVEQYNTQLSKTEFSSSKPIFPISTCGTRFVIGYISPGDATSGLYARFRNAHLDCRDTSAVKSNDLTFSLLLAILALFIIC